MRSSELRTGPVRKSACNVGLQQQQMIVAYPAPYTSDPGIELDLGDILNALLQVPVDNMIIVVTPEMTMWWI